MINWELLTPRNIVVIAAIAIAWHVMLAPVFKSMGAEKADDAS